MYDIILRFGEVKFLVFAIVIVGFVTLWWVLAKLWRALAKLWWAFRMPQAADILNVKNLYSELTTVTDWYRLGLYLDLKTHELDKIEQNYTNQGCDRRMLVMLALWLRSTPTATWKDVVSALQQMGENRVAENIRQKYIKGKSKL